MLNNEEVVERLLKAILDQTPTNRGQVTAGFIEHATNPWKIIPIWQPAHSIAKLQLAAVLRAVGTELDDAMGGDDNGAAKWHADQWADRVKDA